MIDVLLLAHSTLGVLGILAAMWVLGVALNAGAANQGRVFR